MTATSSIPDATPWHALGEADVFARLGAGPDGLAPDEARGRLARVGPNRLPETPATPWWVIFARQFASPLILILGVAAAISLAVHPGDPSDAGFIVAVVVVNAIVGGYQEWRAERSSRSLQQLLTIRATVLRGGEAREIDAEELVPGDVVWLESGSRVPADIRLMQACGLEIDESLLTGESIPVPKESGTNDVAATLADRRTMAHAGSIVVRGRGEGVVVATGASTEVGQLAFDVTSGAGGRPPLLDRMDTFSRAVSAAVLVASAAIAVLGIVLRGYGVEEMFMFGVALAVSAIPEGLPVALTVALAVATSRMARRGVIVRRLAAVEGLGSCTLILSDKTGTLTCNELTVRTAVLPGGRELDVTGEGFTPIGDVREGGRPVRGASAGAEAVRLARAAVLCNESDLHARDGAWRWRGDPTDVALLSFGHKLGLVRERELLARPLVVEIPFEPERQYAATFHRDGDAGYAAVKGAPERVVRMCRPEAAGVREALAHADALARRGYRVLAIAGGPGAATPRVGTPAEPGGLEFLGLVGMIDPLRPHVREAIAACLRAGISVRMITGDHPATALAIARDLGMADGADEVVTGKELEGLSAEALEAIVAGRRVFARLMPRQKLELVAAARRIGHYVAVTGDGVNDAPALRAANIGVAMGKGGTDVAREAAELVVTDDNFATLVAGIEQGRIAYDNIRNVIFLLVSTGAAEVLVLGLAVVTGYPHTDHGTVLPLLPVQLLWLNLVTNGIQDVALAFEAGAPGVLDRPPRSPDEPIFDRVMVERTLVTAAVMGGVGFAAFWWMVSVDAWPADRARNGLLLLMVFFELVHIGSCRSEKVSIFRMNPLGNPLLVGATLLAFVVHVAAMHVPIMQRIIGVEPVGSGTAAVLFGLALTVTVAVELHKLRWRRRRSGVGFRGRDDSTRQA